MGAPSGKEGKKKNLRRVQFEKKCPCRGGIPNKRPSGTRYQRKWNQRNSSSCRKKGTGWGSLTGAGAWGR